MYVADIDQKDWDEYAERLTFALITAYDRIRGETPFYLVHGWDAQSTLEATLPLGIRRDVEPRRWRYSVQRQYQQAHKLANEALRDAIEGRSDQHKEDVSLHDIKTGDRSCGDTRYSGTEYRLFPIVHERELDEDENEAEEIAGERSSKKTRYGRTLREYLGYAEPSWVDETDLKYGA
ncbi:hypothetical protein L917_17547 [Phytophthora nicotianae]|uniref:Reverse transcriptase n=1 Tax=Phytophthora nicotianae TaxID=4792 RepID=W2KD18_PHYNI|nr:hypothetical protein L917_17547 [Phytophthora nicotianae]